MSASSQVRMFGAKLDAGFAGARASSKATIRAVLKAYADDEALPRGADLGRDVDRSRRIAAPPRAPRRYSAETSRGAAAGATWKFRGDAADVRGAGRRAPPLTATSFAGTRAKPRTTSRRRSSTRQPSSR